MAAAALKQAKVLTAGRLVYYAILLCVLTAVVMAACSLVGPMGILSPAGDVHEAPWHHAGPMSVGQWVQGAWDWLASLFDWWVVGYRLSRMAAAAVVGAALAVAGMALQGTLRNPLADPYVLGISSGASIGVLIGIALVRHVHAPEWLSTPALAFAGAITTSTIVYGIAQRRGRLDPYLLLLSGVIVNVFNGALIMAILAMGDRNGIIDFVQWSMGNVSDDVKPKLLTFCSVAVVAGWAVLLSRGAAFNALGLGEEVAASSGVPVHWLRVETFIIVSLMTASAVAIAGPVAFIGLIVPHICRLIVGPDHRRLAIFCGFGGAIFLMLADTLCRFILQTFDRAIQVGIVTAFCGGPFFIYLLRRRSRGSAT